MDVPICAVCGNDLHGRQRLFCSAACRKRHHKGARLATVPNISDLATLVERELLAAGRCDTAEGQLAILLAKQLSGKLVNISGMASLAKEFREVYKLAMHGVESKVPDVVDEVQKRRQAKLAEVKARAEAAAAANA